MLAPAGLVIPRFWGDPVITDNFVVIFVTLGGDIMQITKLIAVTAIAGSLAVAPMQAKADKYYSNGNGTSAAIVALIALGIILINNGASLATKSEAKGSSKGKVLQKF